MNALGFIYSLQGTMTYRVRRAGVDLGTVWRTRTAWGWKRMDGTQGTTRDGANRDSAASNLLP